MSERLSRPTDLNAEMFVWNPTEPQLPPFACRIRSTPPAHHSPCRSQGPAHARTHARAHIHAGDADHVCAISLVNFGSRGLKVSQGVNGSKRSKQSLSLTLALSLCVGICTRTQLKQNEKFGEAVEKSGAFDARGENLFVRGEPTLASDVCRAVIVTLPRTIPSCPSDLPSSIPCVSFVPLSSRG